MCAAGERTLGSVRICIAAKAAPLLALSRANRTSVAASTALKAHTPFNTASMPAGASGDAANGDSAMLVMGRLSKLTPANVSPPALDRLIKRKRRAF
jgi:hypothetical protein